MKKKTGHAAEQENIEVAKLRQDWVNKSEQLEPERLIFIDETWAKTNMARTHGRCSKGQRLHMGIPHGHRKTTTLVAGLRTTGVIAPVVLDGAINGECFEVYVRDFLVPEIKKGDVIVMDNLSSHKRPAVEEIIRKAGASLIFLPPYSPDFNPIEKAFSKIKSLLRKAEERTVDGLWNMIGKTVDLISESDCRKYFKSCGYDSYR